MKNNPRPIHRPPVSPAMPILQPEFRHGDTSQGDRDGRGLVRPDGAEAIWTWIEDSQAEEGEISIFYAIVGGGGKGRGRGRAGFGTEV
jgi:hypothetical protein